jgi:hypothetical protein
MKDLRFRHKMPRRKAYSTVLDPFSSPGISIGAEFYEITGLEVTNHAAEFHRSLILERLQHPSPTPPFQSLNEIILIAQRALTIRLHLRHRTGGPLEPYPYPVGSLNPFSYTDY